MNLMFVTDLAVKFVIPASVDRSQKDNLKQLEAQEEQRLIRGQKEYLDLEIRKFRRKKLLIFHSLEQELLREVRIGVYITVISRLTNMLCYICLILLLLIFLLNHCCHRHRHGCRHSYHYWPIETSGDTTNQNLSIISEVFTNSSFGWCSKIHYIVFNFLYSVICAVYSSHNLLISFMVQKSVSHSSQKTHPC